MLNQLEDVFEDDETFVGEKKKIIKKLVNTMEKSEDPIDLGTFSEAIMWWDESYMKLLGVETETHYGVKFFITPKNRNVWLNWGGALFPRGRKE